VVDGKVVADVPYVALDSFETDTLGRIYYKVTGIAGETVSGYADLPPVPANVPRSEAYPALVRFYHANYNGQPVRIAALLQPVYDDSMRGIALIQVGETLEARRAVQPDPVRHPAVASACCWPPWRCWCGLPCAWCCNR
jgi:two-component system sensor histidine kinase TctE